MSDTPTVQQRAVEVIRGATANEFVRRHEGADLIARALAAAGLLCTPQERAVIEAAQQVVGAMENGTDEDVRYELIGLVAAVDRLAAQGTS